MVNMTMKGVMQDHADQLSKLRKDIDFVQKVRELAYEQFDDDKAAYMGSKEGKMMEEDLVGAEAEVRDLAVNLLSNIDGDHNEVSRAQRVIRDQVVRNFQAFKVGRDSGKTLPKPRTVIANLSNSLSSDLEVKPMDSAGERPGDEADAYSLGTDRYSKYVKNSAGF